MKRKVDAPTVAGSSTAPFKARNPHVSHQPHPTIHLSLVSHAHFPDSPHHPNLPIALERGGDSEYLLQTHNSVSPSPRLPHGAHIPHS